MNTNNTDSWGNNNFTAPRLGYIFPQHVCKCVNWCIYLSLIIQLSVSYREGWHEVCLSGVISVRHRFPVFHKFAASDVSLIQITLYHMKRPSDCNINVIFSTLWAEKLIHFAKRSFLKQDDWRICCWPNDNWACIHCVMYYKHIAKHSKIGTAYELILV